MLWTSLRIIVDKSLYFFKFCLHFFFNLKFVVSYAICRSQNTHFFCKCYKSHFCKHNFQPDLSPTQQTWNTTRNNFFFFKKYPNPKSWHGCLAIWKLSFYFSWVNFSVLKTNQSRRILGSLFLWKLYHLAESCRNWSGSLWLIVQQISFLVIPALRRINHDQY